MSGGLTVTPGVPPHRHPAGSVTGLAAIATTGSSADITDSTAAGRSLLTAADAAAQRTALSVLSSAQVAAGYQPLDADLTAIAALATTTYGRSLLTGADAAETRTTLGLSAVASSGSAADLSGTLADARLSANIAKLGTASQNFTNPVGFGITPTAGNGLVQLATGTTKANGIAFGTDTFIYRSGGNAIKTDGTLLAVGNLQTSGDVQVQRSGSVDAQNLIQVSGIGSCQFGMNNSGATNAAGASQGAIYLGSNGAFELQLTTTGAKRLRIGAGGELHFGGGTPIAKQTAAAAATDAATTQTLANSLRTILINLGLAQ